MNSTESFKQALAELYTELPKITGSLLVKEKKEQFPTLIAPNEQSVCLELEEHLSSFQKKCHNGLHLILQQLQCEIDPFCDLMSIENQLTKAFRSILSPIPFTRAILKITSGSSWRESLHISKQTVDWLYKAAKTLFDEGKYQEAIDAFSFLSWLDSSQYDFWMALGHSCFRSCNYEQAINAYKAASSTIHQEGLPHIYAASCYEALGDRDQSCSCLKEGLTLEKGKEHPNQDLIFSIEQKIEQYKAGLSCPLT